MRFTMATIRKAILSLAVLLLASAPLALAQGTYTQFDVPGAVYTNGYGIDAAGDIVGTYGDASGQNGFLLSGGTYTTINPSGSTLTSLFGTNDVGQIVGATGNASTSGFLYDVATQTFTTISYPKANLTFPYAINNAGTIAGSVIFGNKTHGFVLVGSAYRQISPPRTSSSTVSGITASGILFGSARIDRILTFAFAHGKYSERVIPHASGATVNGVNPAGTALVGIYNPSHRVTAGFLYQNGTLRKLQFPGSKNTAAQGINAAGEVVGTFEDAEHGYHGFIWTPPADAGKK